MEAVSLDHPSTLAERIVERLRSFDLEGLVPLYRADALLDASVPQWRYQLQGPAAIAEQFREELADTGGSARVTHLRATPTAAGVAVELEGHFTEDGEERRWREVHLFSTDGKAIAEHVIYCTGIWDAATIARHAVEAPMVHR